MNETLPNIEVPELRDQPANYKTFASILDPQTKKQADAIFELPFVRKLALMPDAHFGNGSSVGTVILTQNAVIPSAVGVDIGCGMIAVRLGVGKTDIEEMMNSTGRTLLQLREQVQLEIPMSAGKYRKYLSLTAKKRATMLETYAEANEVDLSHSPNWRNQLGTLGSGNHFIELCYDETDCAWLFLHSGSRGVGNKIAQKHIRIAKKLCDESGYALLDRDHAHLRRSDPEYDDYMRELMWAQKFALENRAEMMDRFIAIFVGWMGFSGDGYEASVIEQERINTHHNYTENLGEGLLLTRKGAIAAEVGQLGLIPGSMGTRSYVVQGKGNPQGLWSAPHGAGRLFSRTKARELFTAEDLEKRMVGIEHIPGVEFVDEIPDAYKPIDVVMKDAEPLVSVIHELRQILNLKGK